MKSILSIILACCYLFSSSGMVINAHECGEEVSYSLLGLSLGDSCNCDHEATDHGNDCCSNKTIKAKSTQETKLVQKWQAGKSLDLFCENLYYINYSSVPKMNRVVSRTYTNIVHTGHSPPLYLLYRNFRI